MIPRIPDTIFMVRLRTIRFTFFLMLPLLMACGDFGEQPETLFTSLPSKKTGIAFSNNLAYTSDVNAFTFHSFYNGGGVASGDINNDGLQDLFFCGNQVPNRLYVNKGNLRFEDITATSGIYTEGLWHTGATFADVNGDGWLDIYVCRAADFLVGWRGNQLFINNGDLTFSERAGEYKLDNTGFSTHSVFFDYDNDNDLDCYLLSNSNRSSFQYNPIKDQRKLYTDKGGNKLYRNDGNIFVDVTREAGIYSSVIGFGLGVTISDINKDGWQDIYISNDFFERDYLYINNRDGTFDERIEKYTRELSLFSMGADIADINNDTYPDIYVTDMLPEDEGRLKAKTSFESWERYQGNVKKGYYHQFLRNALQLNRGPITDPATGEPEYFFSEISRLAGVHATDWSWGALIADFDNDGWKDIFVSNGMYKDVTDQDFIQFVANDSVSVNRNDYKRLIDNLPTHPLSNFAFRNNGNLTFTNHAKEWGLGEPGFSNGSAYSDLDNDGDLDLITNDINAPSHIFRNNSTEIHPENKFLKIAFKGIGKNLLGFGSKVTIYYQNKANYLEQMPARGFQSTVDHRLNFGLGTCEIIDSLIVEWPGGFTQTLKNVKVNQTITLDQADAKQGHVKSAPVNNTLLTESSDTRGLNFIAKPKAVTDFNRDKLLYHAISSNGPRMAVGDVNADGLDDVFISGKDGQAPELFLQSPRGVFNVSKQRSFLDDAPADDTDCMLFDADNDNDLDLFITSGGNTSSDDPAMRANRLYLNNGKGAFVRYADAFKNFTANLNCSAAAYGDYDNDGDNDLLIGARSVPGAYGLPGGIRILRNDGHAVFSDVTSTVLPQGISAGMITDVAWADIDNDGKIDIVTCGDFMQITIFKNSGATFTDFTEAGGLSGTNGWWNRILVQDLNNDGLMDIVAGNHGLNSRFKASPQKPVTLYAGDLDGNGSVEQVICTYNGETQYPMVLRHDLVSVMPSLKKKFLKYNDYKQKTIEQVFTPEQLKNALKLNAYHLETCVFMNDGNGKFRMQKLPMEAQFSPVFAIAAVDIDEQVGDEIILGGNLYESKPEAGIYDGSYGLVLKMNERGEWTPLPAGNFFIKGEVRDLSGVKIGVNDYVLVTTNNDSLKIFERAVKAPHLN